MSTRQAPTSSLRLHLSKAAGAKAHTQQQAITHDLHAMQWRLTQRASPFPP